MKLTTETISVASRSSLLARAQVQEVLDEIRHYYPEVVFSCTYINTIGDLDKKTSLRSLNKTDFFTKELDQMLLDGACRITIHSAKDLPEPLPQGLTIAAITHGVDSSDVLVMKDGTTLDSLPSGAIIATSSERREEAVRCLRTDVVFVDIRGTIQERLQKLQEGSIDGVVIAEAAMIRLGLTHMNRVRLPGDTAPLQGKLAVICRSDDEEMIELFACVDKQEHREGVAL